MPSVHMEAFVSFMAFLRVLAIHWGIWVPSFLQAEPVELCWWKGTQEDNLGEALHLLPNMSWLTLFFLSPSLLRVMQARVRSYRRKPSSVFLLLRGQLLQWEIYPLAWSNRPRRWGVLWMMCWWGFLHLDLIRIAGYWSQTHIWEHTCGQLVTSPNTGVP